MLTTVDLHTLPRRRRPLRAPARVALALAALGAVGPTLQAAPDDDPLGELTGGATTVQADGRSSFSFPVANLPAAEFTRFAAGNALFRRPWAEVPSSTRAREGLGPHFIARSCAGCHEQDGRAAPPTAPHEAAVGLLLRLAVPGPADARLGLRPEPVYGTELHTSAVRGVQPEGVLTIRHEPLHGRYADASSYTLHKPVYGVDKLAYGPLAEGVQLGPRVAPQLSGMGLIEAIPDEEILRNAAEQAAAPGPIKGRSNRVWDAYARTELIGRYGWKANVATLAHQTALALHTDIGIGSLRFPRPTCSAAQLDCLAAPRVGDGGELEIDESSLGALIFYQSVLAPPGRRGADDPQVRRGQQLFAQAQCATCHRPSYLTKAAPFPALTSRALNGQRIWPYTDLLLHDMGEALADGRPEFQASGRQWKTPPLWGIGLIREVNGHQRLLHDGRADGVLEAVLWHGGEAEASQQRVLKMSAADRAALVKFVESL